VADLARDLFGLQARRAGLKGHSGHHHKHRCLCACCLVIICSDVELVHSLHTEGFMTSSVLSVQVAPLSVQRIKLFLDVLMLAHSLPAASLEAEIVWLDIKPQLDQPQHALSHNAQPGLITPGLLQCAVCVCRRPSVCADSETVPGRAHASAQHSPSSSA